MTLKLPSSLMKYRLWTISSVITLIFFTLSLKAVAQEKKEGHVEWTNGYVSAVAQGTAKPSGNKARDELRATRAATVLAQRVLMETVKSLKIDSQTTVENKMVREDIIRTRIEGTIQGAEIAKQHVRWSGDTPIATVEVRLCLGGFGVCKSEKSIVNTLNLDQKDEPSHAPQKRLSDIVPKQEMAADKVQDIIYDSSRPVTGVIFNLQGLRFERVILPVVTTVDDENNRFTVYSVKSVDPTIIKTYGVVRYADSVERAKQNPHLGNNALIVPVSGITTENSIMIGLGATRIIRETTSHGNDYLKNAKVVIASK